MSDSSWQVFDIAALKNAMQKDGPVGYQEFLNVPSMHCGVYCLAKGSNDMQTPHDEDEIYYVVEGRAQLRVGAATHDVGPGSVMYVKASEDHTFFEIQEDMVLLVLFATG